MKVIITFIFCCDNLWKSKFLTVEKPGKLLIFKPLPPVGAGGGYMFSGRPSVPLSVRPCVRDSRGSFMFSTISPISVDGFSPNICHWCISGQR